MNPLIWNDGDFRQLPLTGDYRVLVIDSWRHQYGNSFGLGHHAVRFKAAVASVGSAFTEQQRREMWQLSITLLSSPEYLVLMSITHISLPTLPVGIQL